MLNVIRARNSVLRSNWNILYKQTSNPQCLFCSSSENGDNADKDDSRGGNEKKSTILKPVTLIKKSKSIKYQERRLEEGKKAIFEMLQNFMPETKKLAEKENQNQNFTEKQEEDISSNTSDLDLEPFLKPVEIPVASKPVNKTDFDLKNLLHEAAVELGGDVGTTQADLLKAYKSIGGHQNYILRARRNSAREWKQVSEVSDVNLEEGQSSLHVKSIRGDKLGIFTKALKDEEPRLKMWHKLNEAALSESTLQPAQNYFEQLILWTQQGKLWHFPIDNDQDMHEERKTDFTQHIFLDEHLEPWCPKTGPLRHFMELVIVGLSKNPYLSVEQKKEHILWYRDYFEKKRKLLKEIGAMESESTKEATSDSSL